MLCPEPCNHQLPSQLYAKADLLSDHGRGAGVGRGLGVGVALGVGVGGLPAGNWNLPMRVESIVV